MIICPLCDLQMPLRRNFSHHLATTEKNVFFSELQREKFLVEHLYGAETVKTAVSSYVNGEVCTYELRGNVDIRKYLKLSGLKRTSKEERATDRYKHTYLSSIQAKYGNEFSNISQVKEVHQKKVETAVRNYGSYEEYLKNQRINMAFGFKDYIQDKPRLIKTYAKISETCLRKYGVSNFGGGRIARAKNMKTKMTTIATWSYQERLARSSIARKAVCSRGGYESSILTAVEPRNSSA